ncbi:hypothetical protein RHSIM_RhsimUnG0117000 [Rhododendron simsii]|uniref:Uncharacterized protein n=1 Tax=Rhododendron simsii TaxID=118357 RepID=A0A834FUW1_RHOSS|nr:hypothetical protein RHSIM_RhsimUnG0117000 [Rhododendron simsii]
MATQEKLGMVLAEDWSDDSFSSEDENEFSGAAKLFGCDAKEKLGMVPAADWSDDSYSSGDESEFSGVAKLFGCHGDRYMKPWMLAPCPAADDVYDSDSDRDMNDEEYRIYSDQVKKSDGFDVGVIPGVNMVGQIVPVPIDQKKRFYDYDLCSELAVDKNTDDISSLWKSWSWNFALSHKI